MKHGASIAVYGRPSAVMTRSPRPSAGPRWTNRTWSSSWLMMRASSVRQRTRSRVVNWHSNTEYCKVVAVAAHGLEDLAQALVVADVVADQVGMSHSRSIRLASGMKFRFLQSVNVVARKTWAMPRRDRLDGIASL